MMKNLFSIFIFLLCFNSQAQIASPLAEVRYCQTEPKRLSNGNILRRADVLAAFKKSHPCPSTGLTTGSCKGWAIDHIVPLVCGGCDAVWNLQWLPNEIKSASGEFPKDRWEQKVYCQSKDRPQLTQSVQ